MPTIAGIGLVPLVQWIGLPEETAVAFLFGFFRRDYGAAGLYDLKLRELITNTQFVVAAITLTLFLPCVAQFLVMKKEHGWRIAVLTSVGITIVAFTVGFIVNSVFTVLGVIL